MIIFFYVSNTEKYENIFETPRLAINSGSLRAIGIHRTGHLESRHNSLILVKNSINKCKIYVEKQTIHL
jgi:hypothetical protein